MDNLEFLIARLGPHVLSVQRCSADIQRFTRFEFFDDQSTLHTGTVYIAGASQLARLKESCSVEAGAILMVSGVKGELPELPWNNITVIVTSCSSGRLYNLSTAALRERISGRAVLDAVPMTKQEQIHTVWERIRNNLLVTHSEIRAAWEDIFPGMDKYYRISVISPDSDSGGTDRTGVAAALQQALPGSCCFPCTPGKTDEFIVLQFFPAQPFSALPEADELLPILTDCRMHMMIGHGTRDFSRMATAYRLYQRANYLADSLGVEKDLRIYRFENYGMYDVIDLCSQRFIELYGHSDILYLVHPVVVHLSRYDRDHGTNLRDVLFTYLTNNQDLKRTAELLYMHRNTLSNKLNQIRSMTEIDLSNGVTNQRIIFSCQVIRYYERVLSQRMRVEPANEQEKK